MSMKFKLLTSGSYRLKLLLLIVLMPISATLIVARWKLRELPVTQTQSQRSEAEVEAEVVTATPSGFEPAEITRRQGRFLLAVENASGGDDLNLYLERETGTRVNVALSRRGRLRWREILDLPPGRYILRTANDDTWRCSINLMSR